MSSNSTKSRPQNEYKKFRIDASENIFVASQAYGETAAGTLLPIKVVDDGSGLGKLVLDASSIAFTDLNDTPANYTGHGGKFVRVNAGENALEFHTGNEIWSHADLDDMPDTGGTNTDHDKRYPEKLILNEPNGFPDASLSTIDFVAGTRTFSITPTGASFDIYQQGEKTTISSADSVVIDNTSGLHYIYYDLGVLTSSVNPAHVAVDDIILNKVWAGGVYWNATDGVGYVSADERHGCQMSSKTHEWGHDVIGTLYRTGFTLSGTILDTGTDAALNFGIENGEMYDEDIIHEIINGSVATHYSQVLTEPAEIPVLFRDDVDGTWKEQAASTLPYISAVAGNNRLAYNNDDGDGTFSQIEVTDGKWMAYTLISTNDWKYPIKMVQGQNEYTDKKTAIEEANSEITAFGNFPTPEIIILYRFVMQTKNTFGGTKKAKIVDLTDFRGLQIIGTSATATSHGTLSGLADDDHAQYLLVDGTRAMTGNLAMGGNSITGILNVTATGTGNFGTTYTFEAGDAAGGTVAFFAQGSCRIDAGDLHMRNNNSFIYWGWSGSSTPYWQVGYASPGYVINANRQDSGNITLNLGTNDGTSKVAITDWDDNERVSFDSDGNMIQLRGNQTMGTATTDCGIFTMIKGGQTGDPQFSIDMLGNDSGDTFLAADTGTLTLTAGATDPRVILGASGGETLELDFTSGTTVTFGTTTDVDLLDFTTLNLTTSGTLGAGTTTLSGNLVMGDNSVTGVDTITFTDTGTIAGIANGNLVDKSAVETIENLWTFTGVPTGTGYAGASVIVNPASTTANYLLQSWSVANSLKASVDEDGDFVTTGDITTNKFEVIATAGNLTRERLFQGTVSDADGDYMFFNNATGANTHFIPSIWGSKSTDSSWAMIFYASCDTDNDTGSTPLVLYNARAWITGEDVIQPFSNFQQITTRPLFQWRNNSLVLTTVDKSGNWDFEAGNLATTGTGIFGTSINITRYHTGEVGTGRGPGIGLSRAQGTISSPNSVTDNIQLGKISSTGWVVNDFENGPQIAFFVKGSPVQNRGIPSEIVFRVPDTAQQFVMLDIFSIDQTGVQLGRDNDIFAFGTEQDASIYFDGSDFIINSENVTADDEVHFTNFSKYSFDNDILAGAGVHLGGDNRQLTFGTDGATDSYIQWDGGELDILSSGAINLEPSAGLEINGVAGATTAFTNGEGDTVTVTKGIITDVS